MRKTTVIVRDLLVLNEARLPEVLLALLFLLGLVVGHVGGVAPPVVGVVALHGLVILGFLHHLDFVDTLLAVGAGAGGGDGAKAHVSVVGALAGGGSGQLLANHSLGLVEGEAVDKGAGIAQLAGQLAPGLAAAHGKCQNKKLKKRSCKYIFLIGSATTLIFVCWLYSLSAIISLNYTSMRLSEQLLLNEVKKTHADVDHTKDTGTKDNG